MGLIEDGLQEYEKFIQQSKALDLAWMNNSLDEFLKENLAEEKRKLFDGNGSSREEVVGGLEG